MVTPHWITSLGRTATKWLADCHAWPHEPHSNAVNMVSPRHLDRMQLGLWLPPGHTKILIVTRNAEAQMLSIVNRWAALELDVQVELARWPGRWSAYMETIWSLIVRWRAQVVEYEKLTASKASLVREMDRVGFPQPLCFITARVNQYPRTFETLPDSLREIAESTQRTYNEWNARAT